MSTVDLSGLAWRKSTRSTAGGSNGACVEIAFAEATPWRKSTRSTASGSNGNCVEVAFAGPLVAIRDSKNSAATPLAFPAPNFTALLQLARAW